MNPLARPLWSAIASWIIGSLLSIAYIFAIKPELFFQGWYFYIFLTLVYSLGGVCIGGLPILAAFSFIFKPDHKVYSPYIAPVLGVFLGWISLSLIGVIITSIGGPLVRPSDFIKIAGFGLFGSVYGLVGFLCLSILTKRAEQDAAANP